VGQVVVCRGLKGVPDGVTVVQDRAQAALHLVFGHDARLETDGVHDEPLQRVDVSRAGGRDQAQIVEVFASGEEAHFDRLRETVGDLGSG
jgi:hypothetical protein